MKRSSAWFKSNTQQDVYVKGRSVVTMSTTNRAKTNSKSQSVKKQESFVVGETAVGGEEGVGI
jgi:hypothetical protein